MTTLLPSDLGFDGELFPDWREGQFGVVEDAIDCSKRFSLHCSPTGSGKTLIAMAYAVISGGRTLILTASKGLQDQYGSQFDVADIRGMDNYTCAALDMSTSTSCEKAAPRCEIRSGAMGSFCCPHKHAQSQAMNDSVVVTNYSCSMHQIYGQGLGKFDTLIIDEADQSVENLSNFLSFTISSHDIAVIMREMHQVSSTSPHWDASLSIWSEWARNVLPDIRMRFRTSESQVKQSDNNDLIEKHFRLRNLVRKLDLLSSIDVDDWVSEPVYDGVRFDVIWPGKFAERYLFRGIPRVLLFSATINRKVPSLLGINEDNYDFFEYPSTFPIVRAPLLLLPVGNFSHNVLRSQPTLIDRASQVIDRLIDARLDVKGIFHTISFPHLRQFMECTKHSGIVHANDVKHSNGGRRTMDVVGAYKRAPPPALLASPSLAVGFDFPGPECRYQIILKVPFPDATSKVAKARKEIDREYFDHLAATYLCQSLGRGVRSKDDYCQSLCLDTRLAWFMAKKQHLFPKWFIGDRQRGWRFRRMEEGVLPAPIRG